jgi:hypothetical protein
VHDIASGEDFEGFHHLTKEEECSFFWEGTFFLHEFVHGPSIAILVDEVEVVGGFKHVDIFDDIGAALKGGEDVDLVDCAFF